MRPFSEDREKNLQKGGTGMKDAVRLTQMVKAAG